MTWSVTASSSGAGFPATSISTIITSTGNGTFVFLIDMSNMVSGDLFSVRLFTSVASTALVQVWKGTWNNPQINGVKISPPVAADTVFSATFESITGSTSEGFPWKLLSI